MTSKTTTGALWDAVQWRARIFWQGWTGCWMILPRGSSMQTDVMFTLNGGHWRSLTFCHDKKHLCIVNVRKPPFCYLLATEGCPSVWLIPHHGTLVLVMSHLQTIIFSWQMGKMATSYNGVMLISLSLKQCQNIVFMPTEDTACGNKYVGLLRLSTIKE